MLRSDHRQPNPCIYSSSLGTLFIGQAIYSEEHARLAKISAENPQIQPVGSRSIIGQGLNLVAVKFTPVPISMPRRLVDIRTTPRFGV
ncbi:hypothetical protein H9L39_15325 [Fusarium oxysporum f. sp. albedinis]|nr:hypothetical protein H9L39_15325 [Fusarium oxysporum f. sp. albedinis]